MRIALVFFFLLQCIQATVVESPLPVGNYFEGAYEKNIPGVVSLILRIEKDEEETPFSTDILQKLAKNSKEGSTNNFREMAADYLEKITKHQIAMDSKTELRERIRDLRTENTKHIAFLTPLVEGMGNDETVKEFKRYLDEFTDVETRLLDFFTLKKSDKVDRLRLFTLMKKAPDALSRILTDLSAPERIMRKVLAKNKFVDPIFANFYALFRNHAILLTVARTAKEEVTRPEFLEKPELILNLKSQLSFFYENFMRAMLKANAWREGEGFKYKSLFTEQQQEELKEFNAVPHSALQTLFEIDHLTEKLKAKYHYVTVKICGDNQDVKLRKAPKTSVVTEKVAGCTIHILRYPLALAPNKTSGVAQLFRRNAVSVLQTGHNYDTHCAAQDILTSMENPIDIGLIAVAATRSHADLMDDVYSEEGGHKVSLDLVANHERVNPDYWKETLQEKSRMKVVGYFVDPVY